jgi:hypothetical protein
MKSPLLLTLAFLCLGTPALAQTVLYDAAGGQTVSQYGGWIVNPLAFESFNAGTTLYNTTPVGNVGQGGFARLDLTLNRAAGVTLGFTAKVDSESHSGSGDRAGFSVIAITSDLMGIELGFWQDRIWAQSGPAFTKAEEGLYDTTEALTSYELVIVGNAYSLLADGTPIVAGALRNYSAFGNPYNIANFVFFGDDTTSAQASFRTSRITLGASAPEPGTLGLLALGGVALVRRRRR